MISIYLTFEKSVTTFFSTKTSLQMNWGGSITIFRKLSLRRASLIIFVVPILVNNIDQLNVNILISWKTGLTHMAQDLCLQNIGMMLFQLHDYLQIADGKPTWLFNFFPIWKPLHRSQDIPCYEFLFLLVPHLRHIYSNNMQYCS